jgi:hypothetical protein
MAPQSFLVVWARISFLGWWVSEEAVCGACEQAVVHRISNIVQGIIIGSYWENFLFGMAGVRPDEWRCREHMSKQQ